MGGRGSVVSVETLVVPKGTPFARTEVTAAGLTLNSVSVLEGLGSLADLVKDEEDVGGCGSVHGLGWVGIRGKGWL